MDKSEFKDLLFELLNEYGEERMGVVDIITYDSEDKFLLIGPNEQRFEIYVKQQ